MHRGAWIDVLRTLDSVCTIRAYYIICKLDIADILKEKPMTISELAKRTKCDEGNLARLMHYLSSIGTFSLDKEGRFGLTGKSAVFLEDGIDSIKHWIIFSGWKRTSEAVNKGLDIVKTGKNFSELDPGDGRSIYDLLSEEDGLEETFIKAMNSWTIKQRSSIVAGYNFKKFHKVVDIGGGMGGLLIELLTRNPNLRGVLFDQKASIELAKKNISKAGLKDRCELVVGDFFDSIPKDSDLFIMKHVLRDWGDNEVIKILRNCRCSMNLNGTLLVIDAILGPDGKGDALIRGIDIRQMFWSRDARMRTLDEWKCLTSMARLELVSVKRTSIPDATIMVIRKRKN